MLIYPGITPDQVLAMPAMRMFSLLKAGRTLRSLDRNVFFYELCDIAMLPSQNKKYFDNLKGFYRNKTGIRLRAPNDGGGMDLGDPNLGPTLQSMFNKGIGGRK